MLRSWILLINLDYLQCSDFILFLLFANCEDTLYRSTMLEKVHRYTGSFDSFQLPSTHPPHILPSHYFWCITCSVFTAYRTDFKTNTFVHRSDSGRRWVCSTSISPTTNKLLHTVQPEALLSSFRSANMAVRVQFFHIVVLDHLALKVCYLIIGQETYLSHCKR